MYTYILLWDIYQLILCIYIYIYTCILYTYNSNKNKTVQHMCTFLPWRIFNEKFAQEKALSTTKGPPISKIFNFDEKFSVRLNFFCAESHPCSGLKPLMC